MLAGGWSGKTPRDERSLHRSRQDPLSGASPGERFRDPRRTQQERSHDHHEDHQADPQRRRRRGGTAYGRRLGRLGPGGEAPGFPGREHPRRLAGPLRRAERVRARRRAGGVRRPPGSVPLSCGPGAPVSGSGRRLARGPRGPRSRRDFPLGHPRPGQGEGDPGCARRGAGDRPAGGPLESGRPDLWIARFSDPVRCLRPAVPWPRGAWRGGTAGARTGSGLALPRGGRQVRQARSLRRTETGQEASPGQPTGRGPRHEVPAPQGKALHLQRRSRPAPGIRAAARLSAGPEMGADTPGAAERG